MKLRHVLLLGVYITVLIQMCQFRFYSTHAYEGSQIVCPILSKAVTIDGKWTTPEEWSDAVAVELLSAVSSKRNATAYLYAKHDESNFYFLIDFVSATSPNEKTDAAGVTLDPLHNGGNTAQSDDRRFDFYYTGGSMAIGTNATFKWNNPLPQGVEAKMSMTISSNLNTPHEVFEFKIPFSIFPKLQNTIGFAAAAFAGTTADLMLSIWPNHYWRDIPNTWGEMTISDSPMTS